MFNFFKKDPQHLLNKKYTDLLAEAQQAQRNGDIENYSRLSTQAAEILKQLDEFDNSKK